MNVNAAVSGTKGVAQVSARVTMHSDMARGYGPLSTADIKMIEAVTNTKFNWPPVEGQGFPLAALELSLYNVRRANEGFQPKAIESRDLAVLRAQGILSADFVEKAQNYLRKGGEDSESTSALDLRKAQPFKRDDGSIYM
jgi:hypothetical protein